MVMNSSPYSVQYSLASGNYNGLTTVSDSSPKNFSLEFLVGAGAGIAGLMLLQWLLGSGGGHHYSNNHKREYNFGDSGFMDSLDYRKIQEISDITEKSNAGKGSNLEITAVDRNNNPETRIGSDTERGNFQDVAQDYNSHVKSIVVYSVGEDGAIYSKIGITNEYHSKHASADDIKEATESISKEDGRATNKDVSEDSDAVESENTSE
jgi:hypothetical protein